MDKTHHTFRDEHEILQLAVPNTMSDKHIFEIEHTEIKPMAFLYFLPGAVIIKQRYDNETRQENQTGEMTVNISAVFVL